jgi:hypothetical protein
MLDASERVRMRVSTTVVSKRVEREGLARVTLGSLEMDGGGGGGRTLPLQR